MLGRRFFRRLLRHSLCLTAGLLAFAACAYTDYRLWPLDLPAPRKPVLSRPQIQGDRLVLPFATGVASARARSLAVRSPPDDRVRARREAAPRPLAREQAPQLAADILDVAQFYSLRVDYFLGVGAMENDYMDVDGDLTHVVWKKRAQRDDIVLRRGRKRVMVSDYAIGTWQITRETLRAAHQLYLKDQRDYRLLPARLR